MKTIKNYNRGIAEFMGVTPNEFGVYDFGNEQKYSELKYHTSFEWLIPVWKRINSILMPSGSFRFIFTIRPDFCYILDNETDQEIVYNEHGATEEELVYITICEFIEWYNKIKQL